MAKLNREKAMAEVLDTLCPVRGLTLADAMKIATVCEAVAALYEQGGTLHDNGLQLGVKPARLKEEFWKKVKGTGER